MFKNKAQIKRDIILISIVVIAVLVVALTLFFTRKTGETALIKYEDKLLFEIDMETGAFTPNMKEDEIYTSSVIPIISEDYSYLFIDGNPFRYLEIGKGVLVVDNNYYVMGKLGIVHIEYNQSKKMIRVVKETSPYNICSSQGYSNNAPIICLPNLIYITFSNSEVDFIIGWKTVKK